MSEESLEALIEAGKEQELGAFEAEDAEYKPDATRRIERWVHETDAEEWIEKLLRADAEALTRLVDKLDELASREHPAGTASDKAKAFRAYAGVLRFLQAAEEYGYVEVSGPLKVMRLRRAAAAGEIPRSEVTKRKLAEKVGVSDKTITAWDKRAQQLGVTLDDWDYERLRQIVSPRKRGPP
jgi:hypothetical protein